MSASVQVHVFHGATPVATDIRDTEARFKLSDDDAADLGHPVPIPSSGVGYSWRKSVKLYCVSGLGSQLGNLRYFVAAAPSDWAGTVSLLVGLKSTYTQASAADEDGVAGLANADLYTSSSPLTVSTNAALITSNASYGSGQDYLVSQVAIAAGSTPGVKTARTASFRYDEV